MRCVVLDRASCVAEERHVLERPKARVIILRPRATPSQGCSTKLLLEGASNDAARSFLVISCLAVYTYVADATSAGWHVGIAVYTLPTARSLKSIMHSD